MKTFLTPFVFLLLITNLLTAQEVEFGVLGGLSLDQSNIKLAGAKVQNENYEFGFQAGLLATYQFTDKFGLESDLIFHRYSGGGEQLALPILGKYAIAPKFNFLLGPQMSTTLNNSSDNLKDVRLALILGVEYEFNEHFFTQARYDWQLNNSYKGSEDFTSRFNGFNILLGYKF